MNYDDKSYMGWVLYVSVDNCVTPIACWARRSSEDDRTLIDDEFNRDGEGEDNDVVDPPSDGIWVLEVPYDQTTGNEAGYKLFGRHRQLNKHELRALINGDMSIDFEFCAFSDDGKPLDWPSDDYVKEPMEEPEWVN